MKATCTKKFKGRPDNEIQTRSIEVGETVEGDLAFVAVVNEWATEITEKAEPKREAEKKPAKSKQAWK